jgi:hypothetical protein
MNHAKAMGLAIAYDMYKECAEGGLDLEWGKVEKPVSYHKFHGILSRQMMEWDPAHQKYPGDKNMHRVRQLNREQRGTKKCQAFELAGYEDTVSIEEYVPGTRRARTDQIHDSVGYMISSVYPVC